MDEYYAAGFAPAVVALAGINVTRPEPWQCGTASCFEENQNIASRKIVARRIGLEL